MDVANPSSDFEAPKDPGAHKAFASVTDNEILGESENDYDTSRALPEGLSWQRKNGGMFKPHTQVASPPNLPKSAHFLVKNMPFFI